MDETLVAELESAIADTGGLLVRAQKYRALAATSAALVREALALGDAARRLHRMDALDDASARRLLDRAHALSKLLVERIADVRQAPEYRAAVRAHRTGDGDALARLLPTIYAGLEPVSDRRDLFAPVAWLRRGRVRPAADVAADVVAGVEGDGDELAPGVDPDLPAVVLRPEPPPDEPVVVRVPAASLPAPVFRLPETDDHLIHVARLRVPVTVLLAATLASDEQLRVEITPADWTHHRDALARAFAAAGVTVERA